MKVDSYNFSGDWNGVCKFCGNSQSLHQVLDFEGDGVRHVYRVPCEEEKHAIRKRAVVFGFKVRSMAIAYRTSVYLWGKIPFKDEIKLAGNYCGYVYTSIRAFVFLKKSKPK